MKCKLPLSEEGKIDAVFMLRRLQEQYRAKLNKLYVVDLEKAFDRVQR